MRERLLSFLLRKLTQAHSRPWGMYQVLFRCGLFQVKLLRIEPGQAISLQRHTWRHETWLIIDGKGIITIDPHQYMVPITCPLFIPAGTIHQAENTGDTTLLILEVQTGRRFDENDIERLADRYGRTTNG